jgi:hypothetical protein
MSYQVAYVIDMSGKDFNRLLAARRQASEVDLQTLFESESLWDATLEESDVDFNVELTGSVVLLWLPTPYSRLSSDAAELEQTIRWEGLLKKAAGNRRIARFDERLLEQWQRTAGEFWFREAYSADAFFQWIAKQPKDSWASVGMTRPEPQSSPART